ncbi:MAG: bifunctional (p)ppGpp synthetase/guanosine-3',5'-bis(diphosphate) 3'-pyrophosphohydrolase [Candidatus Gastranaerophilales bacterium]|nr:bifunctional (p)ppGpp synthetase/guanosine-3',5'-bis(diphosphate) 3'-pyrophosphohydrolase [Candidatus Gastranaerophilales bacterium]
MEENIFAGLESILREQNRSEEDIQEIYKVFEFAKKLHEGQYRVSEEPYIIHPVEVAKILAALRVDKHTLMAAILHDTIEDTGCTPEQLGAEFGEDVLNLVLGVTKLDKYQFKSKEERQAENFRRMFVAMAKDFRVILLKLADRLHNMRTLNYMAPVKQVRIAQETLDIFAPLANRLGIGKIKAELEDLSLRYLNPDKYFEIAKLVAQKKVERENTVKLLIDEISDSLKRNEINAEITGRAKHYYSIYKKMQRLNVAFNDLYDITAVRVIVDTERQCYEVLGIIHSLFKPIPGRFKDYIAMPKGNGYKSLHTSVIGPKQKPLEVQIRTKEMHKIAEYGVAAHWKYKESGSVKAVSDDDIRFSWMHQMIELDKEASNANEFVEKVKIDLFSNQIFAFTPMGDIIDLPLNATPIDFAFRIHSEVGYKTTGALINGRIAQLDTKLNNGDIVELFTSKTGTPKLHWLKFCVTKQAQSKIRQWFKKHNRDEHILHGRSMLEQELTKSVYDENIKNGILSDIAKQLNYVSLDDLLAAVGNGETTVNKVTSKIKKPVDVNENQYVSNKKKNHYKDEIVGLEGLLYSFAKCCSPVPGELIVGVVTRGKGVSVHRIDCPSLDTIPEERLMKISWRNNENPNKTYVTSIRINCVDKMGMLKDILVKAADCGTNITYANVKTSGSKKVGIIDLGVEVNGIDKLNSVINAFQSLPDVHSVKRIQMNSRIKSTPELKQKQKTKTRTTK